MAIFEGLLSFCNGCGNAKVRCNGRGKPIPLRKARGIVRFWRVMWGEGLLRNPSVLTAKSLINQKGGCIASKTQQSDSLRLAVNPPPFDKGGKCGGAKQGIVQKISLMVGRGSNHHHSWLGLTVQQNLTLLNVRE